ncbi:MAG: hypothetical protein JW938_04615 [Candidatus Omnitrophica bacterium]|nr:hypothetical protein [Candidatus Omnitrophota bacterium]
MRLFILCMMVLFFICPIAFTYEAEREYEHLSLWYSHTQLRAGMNDMFLVLGWFPEETDMLKDMSTRVIKDLDEVSSFLLAHTYSKDFKPFQDYMLEMVAMVKDIYTDIDSKDPEDYNRAFDAFSVYANDAAEQFNEYLMNETELGMPEEGEIIDSLTVYESSFAHTADDAQQYQDAIRLMDDEKFDEAFKIVEEMYTQYQDGPFHDALAVAITDCLERIDSEVIIAEGMEDTEFSLYVLSEIVEKKEYSPLFYKAFYRWRTIEQYFNHGMSNMSEIPNKMYNEKRWEIMKVIHGHLIDHPHDTWAWDQRNLLMILPIIERGGPCGNTALLHWGQLYTDIGHEHEPDDNAAEEAGADGA